MGATRIHRTAITPVWTLNRPGSLNATMNVKSERIKWKDFASRSTCAAVAHLGETSQPVPVRVTWRITLVVGIALTAVSTFYSTRSFMNLSGSSEMSITSDGDSKMEHPRYHICTSNIFNLTSLEEMGFVDPEMISYLTLMMSIFVVSPTLLEDTKRQKQLEMKFNEILSENNIQNVDEILQRALFKCEHIIAGCIAPGINLNNIDCCARFFTSGSFPTTSGACVTTHSGSAFYQSIPAMAFGFVVFVRDLRGSKVVLDNSIVNPIIASQKSISFAIGDKWTDPKVSLFQEKYDSRFGVWTSLAISKTTVNNEEVSSSFLVRRDCANRNQPDRYLYLVPGFDNYTEKNCFYAIRQTRVVQYLNCHLITLPYKGHLPTCGPRDMLSLAKRLFVSQVGFQDAAFVRRAACVGECWKEMYSFTASYSDLNLAFNFKLGNVSISRNESKHLAALNFYYPSFTQTVLVNHYPTIAGWLGVLGGNLGLFLGASMVTLIELIVLAFTCCRSTRR